MTHGKVVNMQAEVDVVFRRRGQPDLRLPFVVDTGFAGALTLPPAAVAALGLPFLQEMVANLADDNNVKADVHMATIVWEGQELQVTVLAMGKRPLLGTALLTGKQLLSQFVDNGIVIIEDVTPESRLRRIECLHVFPAASLLRFPGPRC